MFDGFNIHTEDCITIEKILANELLDFKATVSLKTGVQSTTLIARYKGLRFEYVYREGKYSMHIRGSLPRYYNGLSNYENMSLAMAFRALEQLIQEFGLDPHTTKISSLEFGLNFLLPHEIEVNRLLRGILSYKGKIPVVRPFDGDGLETKIRLSEFEIKIYNKSAQFRKSDNKARIELVMKSNRFLGSMGISTLGDLLKAKKAVQAFEKILLYVISHLVIYDEQIFERKLSTRDMKYFFGLSNPAAWAKLKGQQKENYRKKKNSFAKKLTKLTGIAWNEMLSQSIKTELDNLQISDIELGK